MPEHALANNAGLPSGADPQSDFCSLFRGFLFFRVSRIFPAVFQRRSSSQAATDLFPLIFTAFYYHSLRTKRQNMTSSGQFPNIPHFPLCYNKEEISILEAMLP